MSRNRLFIFLCQFMGVFALLSMGTNWARAGLTFNLITPVGSTITPQQLNGFQEAADYWSAEFTDNVTVNISVDVRTFSSGAIGGATANGNSYSYSDFRTVISTDGTSADDSIFFNALPTGSSYNPYLNFTGDNPNVIVGDAIDDDIQNAIPYVDNDGGPNNSNVIVNTANAKALGLPVPDPNSLDGTIDFNESTPFDYDGSDGIDPGSVDFVGLAIHEIGHILGFNSFVAVKDPLFFLNAADDDWPGAFPIDFARQSTESVGAGADIDLTLGSQPKYISIDGGATSVGWDWSTGTNGGGDGFQASHFRNQPAGSSPHGIMDPSVELGELLVISNLDRQLFDVIGWNRTDSNLLGGYRVQAVPEPRAWLLLTAIGGLVMACRRFQATDP